MKKIIFLLILLSNHLIYSQEVTLQKAILVGKNWLGNKISNSNTSDIYIITNNNDTSFYMINFVESGFVIVPYDERINPILAYSSHGHINPDTLDNAFSTLMNSYKTKIEYVKNNKNIKDNKLVKAKWESILNDNLNSSTEKSVCVPSLFETNHTSRWASWDGYDDMLPGEDGTNICVPLAIAQICKYHKHPKQGEGSNSYYVNNHYCYIDYSQHLYNYDLMPFRLTYCGNGENNCDEGSFDFLPGISEEQKQEISKLIYHVGLGVEMHWNEYTNNSGTYGLPNNWATVMSQHLGYKSNWSYWSNSDIDNDPETFKMAMRNSLLNNSPILFRVGGHAIVIDGFENENYFHGSYGRGGYTDGYYYLFLTDDDEIHLPLPAGSLYYAVVDIEPDFDFPQIVNITTPISTNSIKAYQALQLINISSIIDGNGLSGANIAIYAPEVILSPGFEIKKGAELYIKNENY